MRAATFSAGRRTLALLACASALAVPAAARADSIAYIKDHNVWVAEPDGSRQHQVTLDGTADWPYRSPSQADDGVIVAAHGTDMVRLRQNGEVLSRFDPPDTTDSASDPIGGMPVDVAVSPDGARIAYSYYQETCPPGASCGSRYVTLYSYADRATPPGTFGKLYRNSPSWVSDDRVLVFGGYLQQVNYDSPGGGDDDDVHWFDDHEMFESSTDLGDGELSRQGDRFAAIRGYGEGKHLIVYKVTEDVVSGSPSGPPDYACNSGEEASLDSPTWAPDGRSIAFAHGQGIEVIPLPSVEPGCPGASSGTIVIPGGSEPDFGPAPVNPGPRPRPGDDPDPGGDTPDPVPDPVTQDPQVPAPGDDEPRAGQGDARYRAAVARCKGIERRARRARCLMRAKRARDVRKCRRTKTGKARKRCIRRAQRRYR